MWQMEVFASTPRLPHPVGNGGICSNGAARPSASFAQTTAYPQMTLCTHMVLKAEMVGYASMPPCTQTVSYSQMVALEREPCRPRSGCRNNRLSGRLRTSPQPDRHPHNQGIGPWSTRRELLQTLVTCRRARAPCCVPLQDVSPRGHCAPGANGSICARGIGSICEGDWLRARGGAGSAGSDRPLAPSRLPGSRADGAGFPG